MVAKRGVNADRAARHAEDMKKWRVRDEVEAEYANLGNSRRDRGPPRDKPSVDERQHDETVDKYIATKPFRSKKGDRFS